MKMEEKVLIESQTSWAKLFGWTIVVSLFASMPFLGIAIGTFDVYIKALPSLIILVPTGISVFFCCFAWLTFHNHHLIVTDKRIHGVTSFGTSVDLPMDSISSVSESYVFGSVTAATSSRRFGILFLKNSNQIYALINDLLKDRQEKSEAVATTTVVQNSDEADKLKKYKELLDSGIITEEDFEAKKKQLLGL